MNESLAYSSCSSVEVGDNRWSDQSSNSLPKHVPFWYEFVKLPSISSLVPKMQHNTSGLSDCWRIIRARMDAVVLGFNPGPEG